jgi:radical SAM protein with 4Fe4S-binding SPASM domain
VIYIRYGNVVLKKGFVRLSNKVRLRPEYFGGIVFNSETGDTVEVDHEAFGLLIWLRKAVFEDIHNLSRHRHIRAVIPTLLSLGIIEYTEMPEEAECRLFTADNEEYTRDTFAEPDCQINKVLSAPETVHLAVTYRCGNNCLDCYAREHTAFVNRELDTAQMCGIIDIFADNGVFQLAIGGGEPFCRADLSDICSHAARKGLIVHITTGQYVIKSEWFDVLKHVKSLHIGMRSEELMNDPVNMSEQLTALTKCVGEFGIGIGANIIITRFTIHNMQTIAETLLNSGLKRLIFLRYKPITNHSRWLEENPDNSELEVFNRQLICMKHQYPHIALRVDCASAFMMRDIDSVVAARSGIKGCTAGERIISVAPDGSVYPCSQLVGPDYKAGNLTSDSFESIWRESNVLNKYRNFRQSASFAGSVCGQCNASLFCGGCRIFANDKVGGEPSCPNFTSMCV